MQKRNIYLVLFLIIIILLAGALLLTNNESENLLETELERTSPDYKITEDIVILNVPQVDNLEVNTLTLSSPDFLNLGNIPSKFTCDGEDISPNLEISGVDEKAKSLVLIMEDPDAPDGTWNHWIKFNIPVDTKNINEGEEVQGISGEGTGGTLDYAGPCPPEGKHRYIFSLYSLDIELTLAEGSSKEEVQIAMEDHLLQKIELTGVYEREDIIKTQEH